MSWLAITALLTKLSKQAREREPGSLIFGNVVASVYPQSMHECQAARCFNGALLLAPRQLTANRHVMSSFLHSAVGFDGWSCLVPWTAAGGTQIRATGVPGDGVVASFLAHFAARVCAGARRCGVEVDSVSGIDRTTPVGGFVDAGTNRCARCRLGEFAHAASSVTSGSGCAWPGFLGAIVLAMVYGLLCSGTNLFFDWRALALGIGLYGVFAIWMQTAKQASWAMALFAAFMAIRIALIYALFLRGGGDVIVGMRIPVFDGPTLSAIVFTAVLGLWMSDAADNRWRKLLWTGLSAAAYLMVLLCFRRTFWAELGVATF